MNMIKWREEKLKFDDQPENVDVCVVGEAQPAGEALNITMAIKITINNEIYNIVWKSKDVKIWRAFVFSEEDVNNKYGKWIDDFIRKTDNFKTLCLRIGAKTNDFNKLASVCKLFR